MEEEESRSGQALACQEDRRHSRYDVDGESFLQFLDLGLTQACRIADLSLSGCRVVTQEPLPANRSGRLEVAFKVKGSTFRFNGILRWSDGRQQAGIEFTDMIPRRCAALEELIQEIEASACSRSSAGAAQRCPPPLPTAPAGSLPEAAAARSAPPERRAHVRHRIESWAILILVRSGSQLAGKIVDLSQGGCRLLLPGKFAVDLYARVEVEFGLRGQSFRLAGVIQAIHGSSSVGVRFLDVSERKRQQITELIEALE